MGKVLFNGNNYISRDIDRIMWQIGGKYLIKKEKELVRIHLI